MERVNIGIKGVDAMLKGGLPDGSVIGLTGPPGVGKSIFNLHFVLEGARKGEKCVYISLEEPRENIDRMIGQFKFADEFYEYEKKKKIVIKCMDYKEYERVYSNIFEKVNQDKRIARLVIDSFNVFFASFVGFECNKASSELEIRKMINMSFSMLRRSGLTSILILEKEPNSKEGFYYNIPYIVDGMISLDFLSLGSIERRIFIPKMRWTEQYKESKPFEIDQKKGIVVVEEEE